MNMPIFDRVRAQVFAVAAQELPAERRRLEVSEIPEQFYHLPLYVLQNFNRNSVRYRTANSHFYFGRAL